MMQIFQFDNAKNNIVHVSPHYNNENIRLFVRYEYLYKYSYRLFCFSSKTKITVIPQFVFSMLDVVLVIFIIHQIPIRIPHFIPTIHLIVGIIDG